MNGLILSLTRLIIAIAALRVAIDLYLASFASTLTSSTTNDALLTLDASAAERAELIIHQSQQSAILTILTAVGLTGIGLLIIAHFAFRRLGHVGSGLLGILLLTEALVAPHLPITRLIANAFASGSYDAMYPSSASSTPLLLLLQALGAILTAIMINLAMRTSAKENAIKPAPQL